jgi:hypothetical protein
MNDHEKFLARQADLVLIRVPRSKVGNNIAPQVKRQA